ncbi:IS21 family transposase [Rubrivivax gelatinosus]|uniref:IS21 family transposase n=2 Tax=Rubrivivax gelatinosus TaxID=28068 RepID=UPI0005C1DEEA|nr:IS21 family transposase [Rubrivivax gelatinosus]MBG6082442.1 transposase [Rubrivivax gelatinosus]MBG6082701.1 transposase [Rubrivivax gelatinosus]
MLTEEQAVEIRVMARRGDGVRAIARQLGCSRNTVRRYLRDDQARRYKPRAARPCKLDEYKAYLSERVRQARPRWIPATVLLREIRERGYEGGVSQLKAWLAPMKAVQPEPVVRFETAPGQQMQADFTIVRRGREALVALVATLGYSRAAFVKFGVREDAAALCAGLREAFDYFGGVPEEVLFDNTKAVVIERDAYGPALHRWNDELRELAEGCGFKPRLCRPYRAKTKGKVERFNAYLKGSFVVPLAASLEASGLSLDADIANAKVRRWLDEVANVRVHGTTGEVPMTRLAEERAVMLPAPALKAPPRVAARVAMPVESLQHPLAVYQDLLEAA